MCIAHVTEAPSTGTPLFKQAEETQITIKIIDLHPCFLKWNLIEIFIHQLGKFLIL